MNKYSEDAPKNDYSKLILLLTIAIGLLAFGFYNLNEKVDNWSLSRWDYLNVTPQDLAFPAIGLFVLLMANNERRNLL